MTHCTCKPPEMPDPNLVEARRLVAQGRSAILERAILQGAWDRGQLVQNALAQIQRGQKGAL